VVSSRQRLPDRRIRSAGTAPQDFRRRHRYAQEPAATRLQEARARLQAIAHRRRRPLVDLAIAWVLRRPDVTGAIMGIRDAREAQAMAAGVDWTLTADELDAVEQALQEWTATRAAPR
jgi:aryl-alcohol dehydrogenase-like predicted oxidoreductase